MCGRFVLETPLKATAEIFNAQMQKVWLQYPILTYVHPKTLVCSSAIQVRENLDRCAGVLCHIGTNRLQMGHYYSMLELKRLLKNLRSETLAVEGDV